MIKYFVCQTNLFKTYIFLPNNWSGVTRKFFSWMINIKNIVFGVPNNPSLSKSILGPSRMFINITVTPLRQGETEPTIDETHDYFEGFSYRQNLYEPSTSTINVLSKDRFTAKYYRVNSRGAQLIKKYCLYDRGVEYLITTVLANVPREGERPPETEVIEKENIYDNIVRSFLVEGL